MHRPARVAVLVSGSGTNLQALLDRFNHSADAPARVELVVASRPGIGALERAARARVPSLVLASPDPAAPDHGNPLGAELDRARIDLVVLAGYLRLVPATVVRRYSGRMLNIHPALLPAFGGPRMYGIRVHRAVLDAGVRVTGATVHLVDEEYDRGRILAQWPVPVSPDDSPESLAARVLAVEHRLLPAVVEVLVRGGGELSGGIVSQGFTLVPGDIPPDDDLYRMIAIPQSRQPTAENR